MKFELLPVLDIMFELYQKPPSPARFRDYLQILQGNTKADLAMPVGGFNPMAKEHVLVKLSELKALHIEQVMQDALTGLNASANESANDRIFKVAFNLSDDLKGGWTNRFTTDYDSKFKFNALIARNFCVPVFWTSENYTTATIVQRTLEYCYRTACWLSHPKPKTLEQHIFQEQTLAEKMNALPVAGPDFDKLNAYYQQHKYDTDYLIIFNFLYGDEATASLGNNTAGIKETFAGYEFAKWLAR